MSDIFDVIAIGAGPGGYVCAIRAAQLGMRVACVESRKSLGGTCLNVGCIPSKVLLNISHLFAQLNNGVGDLGINVDNVSLNIKDVMSRKHRIISDNVKGIEFLLSKNNVKRFHGTGKLIDSEQVEVKLSNGTTTCLSAKNIVIATGSAVAPLPNVTINEKNILSSTGALQLDYVPKKMAVIGAGVIGLELGSVWSRFGSEVTVIEYGSCILPNMDSEVQHEVQRILQKQNLQFMLNSKVVSVDSNGDDKVTLQIGGDINSKSNDSIEVNTVLVSVGRIPHTKELALNNVGITTDQKGFIAVDCHCRTSVSNIFAIGDVVGGKMLAHKAEEEGIMVAEVINNRASHVNYPAIPAVVYTDPEVAMVGMTEEEVIAQGIEYKVGKFPFSANSRARIINVTSGFVKVIADAVSDKILGCHIVGPNAGDLIQEVVIGMEFSASAEDIAYSSHGHPQLGEAIKEAMLAVNNQALHI